MNALETTMNTPESMYVSLNQAAKIWGKSKGTISKMASSGKIQWHTQPGGERKLLLSELAHYFGEPPSEQQVPVSKLALVTSSEQVNTSVNAVESAKTEAELKAARDMIDALKSQMTRERELLEREVERERMNADAWRRAAENATEMLKALPAPFAETGQGTTIEQVETPRKLSFLERLTGKARGK
jgi:hypothetical protein